MLQTQISLSFALVFIAFSALALYLYLERDRVPEAFRTTIRVSIAYISIAAVNYFYMRQIYAAGLAAGITKFPTEFRYIDWILTTPLMLLKFPLLLGAGKRARRFMYGLVGLDLFMIITGYIGELNPEHKLVHNGMFLIGAFAWFGILAMLFSSLTNLPDRIGPAVRAGIRAMSLFVVLGWAIYPAGYLAPFIGVPDDVRELVYNIGDLINKGGLCLLVYFTAKSAAAEEEAAREAAFENNEDRAEQEEARTAA